MNLPKNYPGEEKKGGKNTTRNSQIHNYRTANHTRKNLEVHESC